MEGTRQASLTLPSGKKFRNIKADYVRIRDITLVRTVFSYLILADRPRSDTEAAVRPLFVPFRALSNCGLYVSQTLRAR